jgi:4-amino-4-deoxychorismate lyase
MSPFIETIKLLDGRLYNLEFHQVRFERTRRKALGIKKHPKLEDHVDVPDGLENGLYKCRLHYGREIQQIEFEPYKKLVVNTLKIVRSNAIKYGFKFSDRSELEALYHQKENCDDILIIKKNLVTDSYYANVALWDGDHWYTPNRPLLPGTMRAYLLDRGSLTERTIRADDLQSFLKVRLINALTPLEDSADIPTQNIIK